MADKRTRRQQKKREKQRKAREAKQRARRERNRDARGGLGAAAHWPIGECYLSSNWHEQGARVWAAFVRTHASGRSAVALCEVDLAERGVVHAQVGVVDGPEHVHGLLVEHSEPYPMLETAPEQVVAVVEAGVAEGARHGHTPPRALDEARRLWADVDPSGRELEVLTGEPPAEPTSKGGWLARLFGGG